MLNERSLDPVLPALSLYLHSLWVHARVENPAVYQTFFITVMNLYCSNVAKPLLANLFYSVLCSIGYRLFLKNLFKTLTFFIAVPLKRVLVRGSVFPPYINQY